MWKQFVAPARGRRFEAGEGIVDRNALTVLRQQLRDCATPIACSRVMRRSASVASAAAEKEKRPVDPGRFQRSLSPMAS